MSGNNYKNVDKVYTIIFHNNYCELISIFFNFWSEKYIQFDIEMKKMFFIF